MRLRSPPAMKVRTAGKNVTVWVPGGGPIYRLSPRRARVYAARLINAAAAAEVFRGTDITEGAK
jgi:hypothetical protein